MPRTTRDDTGGLYCHVLNRGKGRAGVFHDAADYAGFVELLSLACDRIAMRKQRGAGTFYESVAEIRCFA